MICRQKVEENVTEYAARLSRNLIFESNDGQKGLETPINRGKEVEIFLRGLRIPRMREFVAQRNARTLEEAVSAALVYEAAFVGEVCEVRGSWDYARAEVEDLAYRLHFNGMDEDDRLKFVETVRDVLEYHFKTSDEANQRKSDSINRARVLYKKIPTKTQLEFNFESLKYPITGLCLRYGTENILLSLKAKRPRWVHKLSFAMPCNITFT